MSFRASAALQAAVYQALRADPALHGLVGDAIFDAMPATPPSGTHVALGPEDVADAGDMTGGGARQWALVRALDFAPPFRRLLEALTLRGPRAALRIVSAASSAKCGASRQCRARDRALSSRIRPGRRMT